VCHYDQFIFVVAIVACWREGLFLPGLASTCTPPISVSHIIGITDVYHHAQLKCLNNLCFVHFAWVVSLQERL
jgi:hypothetical protein